MCVCVYIYDTHVDEGSLYKKELLVERSPMLFLSRQLAVIDNCNKGITKLRETSFLVDSCVLFMRLPIVVGLNL